MSFASFILSKATKSAADAEVMARRRADGRTGKPKRAPKKRGRPAMKWTDDRDLLLEELAKEFSGPEIAARMGVSYNAIKARAYRLGLELPVARSRYHNWKPSEFARLENLYRQGMTSIEMGKVMGLTDIQIRGALNRLGLNGKRKKWTLNMEYTVARWFNFNDNETLCNALGLKESSIRARYGRLSRQKRLEDLRDSKDHNDLVAEYCRKNGIALPARNKR